MPFSLIIPTYKRPVSLARAVGSGLAQTVKPAEVIVIDDDATLAEDVARYRGACEAAGVEFVYYRKDHAKERRGLSESKNLAAMLAKHDLIYIDDDIELTPTFIEEVERTWKRCDGPGFAGVGGRILHERVRGSAEKMFHRLFGLSSRYAWDVTDVGFQVWPFGKFEQSSRFPEGEDDVAYYLHGGLCALKKSVVIELGFTVFAGGRTGLEDVDFCLRAKRAGYRFAYAPHATATHHHEPAGRESQREAGRKETVNRIDIYRRLGDKSLIGRLWFLHSLKGWILRAFLSGQVRKGTGMIEGIFIRRT